MPDSKQPLTKDMKIWFPGLHTSAFYTHAVKNRFVKTTYCGMFYGMKEFRNTPSAVSCPKCLAALEREGKYVTTDC